jgi:GAF domain-containing protein
MRASPADLELEAARVTDGPDGLTRALELALSATETESGTIHLLERDGLLHLAAASAGIPLVVLEKVRVIPVGKGMAGLAVERAAPVTACNLQTDASGDVRPGARATGLAGSIVVPILLDGAVRGALGVANVRERSFSPEETELLLAIGRGIARASRSDAP